MHTARLALIVPLLLSALACGDGYATAQSAGTIEAFEEYLANDPDGRYAMQATAQLETLYLEDARKQKTLAAYDRYLERFPKGDLREKALAEREEFLFDWAKAENTLAGWETFLTNYPKAEKKRLLAAERARDVASYAGNLSWTEVVVSQVNLAEDPKGPLDGWGFATTVTNGGDKTLSDLRFTLAFLGDDGRVLLEKEWPVVAKQWPIPMEPEKSVPMKPEQRRDWLWTDGEVPQPWLDGGKKVAVRPTRIAFVE